MDIEQLKEFFNFLMTDEWQITPQQAFRIIYFLQERFIIPDNFELCADCLEIFDTAIIGGTRQGDNAQVCGECTLYDFCCSGCCEYVPFGTVDDDGYCERCREALC